MSDTYHAEMTGRAAFIISMLLEFPSHPIYRDMAKEWIADREQHLQDTIKDTAWVLVKEQKL